MENYKQVLEKVQGVEHVVAAAPFIYSQVMLTSDKNISGVVLRGIDPESEALVTNLGRNITTGDLKHLSLPPDYDGPAGIVLGSQG